MAERLYAQRAESSDLLDEHEHDLAAKKHMISQAICPSPADDPTDAPASLDRICCLRCAKRLEEEDDVACVFPNPRSLKCERCTRLKSKCLQVSPLFYFVVGFLGSVTPLTPLRIPAAAVPAARALLALQDDYLATPSPGRRLLVCAAARDLMVTTEVQARQEPKTKLAASLALLAEQRETNRLLGLLLVSAPGPISTGLH